MNVTTLGIVQIIVGADFFFNLETSWIQHPVRIEFCVIVAPFLWLCVSRSGLAVKR